ncbi:abortive infection family protein [Consotaella salsifontis]|uniref:Abortive infection C-terminus n=1 Tax=Consotaella salsifontis TaxID=1365950 RepID=A0A1T4SP61_9HYPH|nr:abortive infection family protein [Consotaella salsifontis]SKA30029.1 Abortive infection C-terminus [Consotaella salsifontis]
MTRDLISKTTRNEFRELLVGYTLREIEMTFDAGNLTPREGYQPIVSGERRGLVEAYYANLDFTSPTDVKDLLVVYEEVIELLRKVQDRVVNPESVDETIGALLRRMERDGFRYEGGRFVSDALNVVVVHTPSLVQLSEASIQEHLEKARQKIANGDPAGAIANAYTLVEEFLKQLLRKIGTAFNENEGDIRALYKLLAEPLHLVPKNDSLESYLKAILEGLQRQIGGLFEVANKASDRHARKYNPAPHHARLAVNAAFTLCEFLLEAYEYQQKREERRVS